MSYLNKESVKISMRNVGRSIPRREDPRILVGNSRFVGDIKVPGMVYGRLLRSPLAHARIKAIDVSAARALPGVLAVLDARDTSHFKPYGNRHTGWPVGDKHALAVDKVRFVGDEIAVAVAVDPYIARDAAELINVEYEELTPIVDPERGMDPDAPLIHEMLVKDGIISSNVLATTRLRAGDIAKAEDEADLIVKGRFYCNRPVCNPLETHGCLALYDPLTDELTLWSATQTVDRVRDGIADVIGIPIRKLRVIACDVGGGFGVKAGVFSHEILAVFLAMRLKRPVQILLDRAEELQGITSRCAQIRYSELLLKKDGRFLGWRERIVQDQGGYAYTGLSVLQLGTQIGLLPYKFPNVWVDGYTVYTNKIPGAAYRAYGVPQTAFARDSLVHMAALKLGCEPEELMRQNMVRGDECPFTFSLGQHVDSTGADKCLEKIVSEAKRLGWKSDSKMFRGIGYSTTLKYSSARHPRTDYDYDSVRVCLHPDGGVMIATSASSIGQGIETALVQIASDLLGVSMERFEVCASDSNGPRGLGIWGSRGTTVIGNALVRACGEVKKKLGRVASHVLECSETDLVFEDDAIRIAGVPDKKITIRDVVLLCEKRAGALPPGVEAGPIDVTSSFDSPTTIPDANGVGNATMTYSAAAHACYVEVDSGTGKVKILGYVMAEDSGVVVNPMLVEGQHQGAVAMALGQILYEGIEYDENGQPLNGNYRDYYVPLAPDIPDLSQVHDCGVPSSTTLIGQRSTGESGSAPPMAAVANAIADAIGIRFTEMPITPEKILMGLRSARDSA